MIRVPLFVQQGSIDASYAGEFFFRDGAFDWVWSDFYVAGVKWRSRKVPKIPLIQPEKVASLPTDIKFGKYYDYRLRGTAVVDGPVVVETVYENPPVRVEQRAATGGPGRR